METENYAHKEDEIVVVESLDDLATAKPGDYDVEIFPNTASDKPQLFAILYDGTETSRVVDIQQYICEKEEEGTQIPREIGTALLAQAPAIYGHYSPEYAQMLVDRIASLMGNNSATHYKT